MYRYAASFINVDIAVQSVFGNTEELGHLVAGLRDEESAGVIEKVDGLDLVVLGHERHRHADERDRLLDQFIQELVDIVRDVFGIGIAILVILGSCQLLDGRFKGQQVRDVVIDRQNVARFAFFIADEDRAGLEDPAVVRTREIRELVFDIFRILFQSFQHDAGGAAAELAVGHMSVLDENDRIADILLFKIVNDDFTVMTEVRSQGSSDLLKGVEIQFCDSDHTLSHLRCTTSRLIQKFLLNFIWNKKIFM